MKKLLFILIMIGFVGDVVAQEEDYVEDKKKNRISVLMGYAFIDRGVGLNDEKEGQIVPTLGIDYSRALSEKFSLGIFTDIELSSYFIETDNDLQVKRENAVVLALAGIYEFVERWSAELGYGVELEENESFQVLRLGTSYEIPIRKEWDVSLGLSYDFKEEYSSWSFVIGFGKSF